jgi:hypothetical protein
MVVYKCDCTYDTNKHMVRRRWSDENTWLLYLQHHKEANKGKMENDHKY